MKLETAERIVKSIDSFIADHQEMLSATRFPAVPLGKSPGTVHPQNSFTSIAPAKKKNSFFMLNDGVKWDKVANMEIKRDNLNAVPQVIDAAIIFIWLLAASGKSAGIVQPQSHLIRNIPKTNTDAAKISMGGIPSIIKFFSFIIFIFYNL